jgi:AcrR family transcriptional regulator
MTPPRSATRLNPRKQPAQPRSSRTVGVILEAAAHILEQQGFEGYTTNSIAERAGVSIGSLYQYYEVPPKFRLP